MVINSVTYRWIYFFIYLSVAEVKFNPQTPSPLTPHPLMPKSGLVSDICGIKIQQELFYRLHPIFHLTLASFSFFFYALHCLIEQEHVAPCRTKTAGHLASSHPYNSDRLSRERGLSPQRPD